MKRYLFITSAIFVMAVLTRAQTNVYHPFPDSNATWCCLANFSGYDCIDKGVTYTIRGKQLINNKWYNRILVYDSTSEHKCTPPSPNYSITISFDTLFIRQDIPAKKVWIYDPPSNTDKILYDFNLNVGDTLDTTKAYFANGFGGYKIITSIDSVLINGTYRKRFNYATGCFMISSDTSMIEGIGALHGLLYPPSCFEISYRLTAFKQDNILLYNPYGWNNCYNFPTSVAQNKNKLLSVNIFPNPVSDMVHFENLPYEKINLKITNIFGEEVYYTQLKNTKTFSIPFENYAPGIYFISIQSESGTSINKKIIKQ